VMRSPPVIGGAAAGSASSSVRGAALSARGAHRNRDACKWPWSSRADVETSDKLTDPQIVARVKENSGIVR
jgi:hypothetical protein